MAQTRTGLEFYLVEVAPATEEADRVLRESIRPGDGVFWAEGKLYAAIVADVRGSAQATRRLMRQTKERGLPAQIRLVSEPFPENLQVVASRVITGDVPVAPRLGREIDWKD